ncbi:RidA family protein [Pedobacter puniceum]|jgi:enamine deaminase RidA (YjgF/YER057c/UK114 family)|uniref:RidA family protein n=1 Tax=Pedobacter puniceum TaxID=2666136 RepID=A0A7K0FMT6_9SPHI|nr:RidA family protein [Pedobacter puniceum]MRX47233.1 RidA family protein [Pedobacter puniceum]
MTNRQNFTTGSPWEDIIGYCRAVKVGNTIEIAGTTMAKDADGNAITTLYGQTKAILEKLKGVLEDADASLENVVRTRMFLTDISQWEEAAKAHGEYFKDIKPVTTMVEVSKLIDPEILIEIEVTAILG